MGGDAMRPVSINKGEMYEYPKAQYENHSVNQDEKTQRESLNKAPYDLWCRISTIYCMHEELRFVPLAHKEFCIEKSSDPEYNEQFNVNLLRPGFSGWNFFDQLSIFRTNNRGKYPPVCKYRSWPTRRKEHLQAVQCNDDEEDLALQLIHRLSRQ